MVTAESQQMGALLVGIEKVTYLTNRCKIYEMLYLQGKQYGPAAENLQSALVALYAAMLRFLAHTSQLYERGFSSRALRGALSPDKVFRFVDECQELEKQVNADASVCEATHNRVRLSENEERL